MAEVTSTPDQPTTAFRLDIQGLRAVAVLAVLLWHAGVSQVGTGYVGVDAFFVISGFLITGLLIRERSTNGRIDLGRFYARRAKRLLPAAAIVTLATAVLTVLLIPKIRWSSIASDGVASALYFQNWRLAGNSVDYLLEDAAPSPFQHFWSLAVEEQFYLAWPVLVILLTPALSLRRGWFKPRLLIGVSVVIAASFGWSVFYTGRSPGPAYFVTTTRVWQFGIGAALAIAMGARAPRQRLTPRRSVVLGPVVAVVVGWVGLVVLIASAVALPEGPAFPGWIAAVPTLATAFVLAAGQRAGRRGPASLLSARPMVFIGTISYSLYLWHWPILVAFESRFGPLSLASSVGLVAASAVPAYATYRFVEEPIRHAKFAFSTPRGFLVGAGATAVATLSAFAVAFGAPSASISTAESEARLEQIEQSAVGLPSVASTVIEDEDEVSGSSFVDRDTLASSPESSTDLLELSVNTDGFGALAAAQNGGSPPAQVDTVENIVPDPFAAADDRGTFIGCSAPIGQSETKECIGGVAGAETRIVLVGDSIAHQWATGISVVAEARGWELVIKTKSGCSYTGLDVIRQGDVDQSCVEWNAAIQHELLADPPEAVVFTGRERGAIVDGRTLSVPEVRDVQVADHVERWNELTAAGIRVVVLAESPNPPENIAECVSENSSALAQCAFAALAETNPDGSAMDAAAKIADGVARIDVNDYVCSAQECPVVTGGVLVYRDGAHLTDTYIRSLTPLLVERFDQAGIFTSGG